MVTTSREALHEWGRQQLAGTRDRDYLDRSTVTVTLQIPTLLTRGADATEYDPADEVAQAPEVRICAYSADPDSPWSGSMEISLAQRDLFEILAEIHDLMD